MDHTKKRDTINLLIIHKDEDFLQQAKTYLETIDSINVYTVTNPEEVLPLITTCFYDIIVMDNELPGMTGLQVLKELRNKKVATPVIMFVDEGQEKQAIQALNLGAEYYIQKGLDISVLFMELCHFIAREKESRSEQEEQVVDCR